MPVFVDPGTQPPDVEAAESAMFPHSASTSEFLGGDRATPMRTSLDAERFPYVPQSVRHMEAPVSLRSMGSFGSGGDASTPYARPSGHVRSNSVSSSSAKRPQRLVAVRYFLDRPGYGLHNSAMRMWFEPPAKCSPGTLLLFLKEQGIALDDLLVEVFLDRFESFMLLEACEAAAIEWNFAGTTPDDPGVLNIRLTDVSYAARLDTDLGKSSAEAGAGPGSLPQQETEKKATPAAHPHANTTPVGLFSFSMMVGLETAEVMSRLVPNFISPQYVLAWGPYMFFVGGMLQLFTATLQVLRNNIYGAV